MNPPALRHDLPADDLAVQIRYLRPGGLLAGFHAELAAAVSGVHEAGEQWAPTDYVVGRHRHRVWELYLQAGGSSAWEIEGIRFVLGPGDYLGVPPGAVHGMAGRPSARHHFFYVAFDADAAVGRLPFLAPGWRGPAPLHGGRGAALEGPFRQLIRELTLELPHRHAGLGLALETLLVELDRLGAPPSASPAAGHPAVLAARATLDASYAQPWPLVRLARAVGLSANHLAELFARDTGTTPHRYLVERRIQRACELLAQTDLPITTVALDLGFSSSSHFARAFRRSTGASPRAFRLTRGASEGGSERGGASGTPVR